MATLDSLGVLISPEDDKFRAYKFNINAGGYARRGVYMGRVNGQSKNRAVLLHREIMSSIIGRTLRPTEEIDHINRNPLDNRRENLRIVTRGINAQNIKRSAIGILGISWDKTHSRWKYLFRMNKALHYGSHKRLKICKQKMDAAKESAGYIVDRGT